MVNISITEAIKRAIAMMKDYADDKFITQSDVEQAISNLVDSAPEALDTLNELAEALGDNPNFATSVAEEIGKKANSADLSTVATSGSYNDLKDTPGVATASMDGLMSADDKTKLIGIAAGANNYAHPDAHPASMITTSSTQMFVSQTEKKCLEC